MSEPVGSRLRGLQKPLNGSEHPGDKEEPLPDETEDRAGISQNLFFLKKVIQPLETLIWHIRYGFL
jgi:hypothetical protein